MTGNPVYDTVSTAISVTGATVLLSGLIQVFGILFFGCLCYSFRGDFVGRLLNFLCIGAISIPAFYLASSFIDVFATQYHWISVTNNTGIMKYLPAALCLSVGCTAFFAQLLAKKLEYEMNQDSANYARCRGLSETRILICHALPHAIGDILPNFFQMIGLCFAGVMHGGLVTIGIVVIGGVIVMVLGLKPNYILADEPTSALDEENRIHLVSFLKECKNTGILFISHDTEALKMLCSETMVMEKGVITERNEPPKLFDFPQREWTKLFARAARQLSGGEQRRLSLLRALSVQPKYLILDEVTSGLDLLSSDRVLSLLENYHHQYGCSYLIITHEIDAARRLSSHIFELSSGRLVREGTQIKQSQNLVNGKETIICANETKKLHHSFMQQRSAWVG